MKFVVTAAVMFAFWILLSGEFTAVILTSAVVSSLLVAFLSGDLFYHSPHSGFGIKRLVRLVPYTFWLLWEIVKANMDVAHLTLKPRMQIDPRIIKFKVDLKTELGITNLSNSITLTPGTVTLSANDQGEFIVHALTRNHAEGLLSGEMQAWVKWVEEA